MQKSIFILNFVATLVGEKQGEYSSAMACTDILLQKHRTSFLLPHSTFIIIRTYIINGTTL